MRNKTIRNLLLIFLALCSTLDSWSSSSGSGWEAVFFTLITKCVVSLLHTCFCRSTEPLEHCLPCAPLFCCFFLYNSLLHRAFQQGSFGEDLERVSYSFPLPSPAVSWHGPSTFLLVIIVAVCFYRPLVQRGAVASPLHSLVLLFPLVFMKDFCR